ncbi:MAG: sulfotransferase domain-containing protein [Magnetococcales bacterium]|nr:sulfotransferase domain-containing protein [Magnetococcales bacterium]
MDLQTTLRDALLAHKAGHLAQAEAGYRRMLDLNPDDGMILKLLGQLLAGSEAPERGEEILRRAVGLMPRDATVHFLLGHALLGARKADEALASYRQTRALQPDFPRIHYFMGTALVELGRVQEASDLFLHEITHNPDDAGTCYRVGRILLDRGLLHQGMGFINQALTNQPELLGVTPIDLTDLGQYLRHQRQHADFPAAAPQPVPFSCYSYPKCGTHLLSDVLQLVTGHTFYWPTDIPSNETDGTMLERIPRQHFLIGHWHANPTFVAALRARGHRVIVQYRDPRDQVVSFYFYYRNLVEQTENAITRVLKDTQTEEGLNRVIAGADPEGDRIFSQPLSMMRWMSRWLRSELPVLFVSFDEMVNDKPATIGRIARFLGRPLAVDQCLEIARQTGFDRASATMTANKTPDRFKRKGVAGDWRNHFTPANIALFKAVAGDLVPALGFDLAGWQDPEPTPRHPRPLP